MLRESLEKGYNRTVGAVRNALAKVLGSVTSRGRLIEVLYVLLVVALMAGFIDAVFFPVANQAQIISPGPGAQTIPEVALDGSVIWIGVAGIYLAYVSGRQTTKSRMVNMYLSIALLLIAVSVFTGVYLTVLKG